MAQVLQVSSKKPLRKSWVNLHALFKKIRPYPTDFMMLNVTQTKEGHQKNKKQKTPLVDLSLFWRQDLKIINKILAN